MGCGQFKGTRMRVGSLVRIQSSRQSWAVAAFFIVNKHWPSNGAVVFEFANLPNETAYQGAEEGPKFLRAPLEGGSFSSPKIPRLLKSSLSSMSG